MASARPLRRARPVRASRSRPGGAALHRSGEPLRDTALGQGLLPRLRRRRPGRAAHARGRAQRRAETDRRRGRPPRHLDADGHPLPADPLGRGREPVDAFGKAIAEYGYGNVYLGVFPIKVNQKREVVDEIVEAGRPGSGSRRAPRPSCRRALRGPAADGSSSATATKTPPTSAWRSAAWHGQAGLPDRREALRDRPDPRGREGARRRR